METSGPVVLQRGPRGIQQNFWIFGTARCCNSTVLVALQPPKEADLIRPEMLGLPVRTELWSSWMRRPSVFANIGPRLPMILTPIFTPRCPTKMGRHGRRDCMDGSF